MPVKNCTKADIVDALYVKTGMERSGIKKTIDLFLGELKEALKRREVIELRGFGTFEIRIRKARHKARNPRTGETISVNSHGVVAFRSGQDLKQAVWNINNNEKDKDDKETADKTGIL